MSSHTNSIYVQVLTSKKENKNISYHEWERKFKEHTVTKDFLPTLLSWDGLLESYTDPSSMLNTNNTNIWKN